VIDLGIMDAISGLPVGINDKGTIVGTLRYNLNPSERPEERGFVYNDGMMRYLAGRDSLPLAIGPSGAIVGTDLTGIGQFLIWEPGAEPRPLTNGTYHAGWGGRIIGVNARGDILASIGEEGPEFSTALYRTGRLWRNGSPVDLGQLNASLPMRTLPTAWNTRGQIVGWSPVTRLPHAGDDTYLSDPFLWENGVMRDLGILGSSPCGEPVPCGWGIATAINIHGTVVGLSTADSFFFRAFIWENGEMRDLGVFPGHATTASAINDRGQVLGTVWLGTTYQSVRTFLWENGAPQLLPFTGSLLGPNGEVVGSQDGHVFIWESGQVTDLGEGSPIAMNNRGEIIGTRGALPTLWRKRG
jgi:probable HAF family extracellular repeat protein